MRLALRCVMPFGPALAWGIISCGIDAAERMEALELRFDAPPRLAAVSGMTAKVEITDVGTFDLKVAADGSASGEIRDVPVGSHALTIRFHKNEIVLAEVTRSLELASGQRVEVKVTPAEFKYPDSDGNGVSNLDEILTATGQTSVGDTTQTTQPITDSKTTDSKGSISLRFTSLPEKTVKLIRGKVTVRFEWVLDWEYYSQRGASFVCASDGYEFGCTSPQEMSFDSTSTPSPVGSHTFTVTAEVRPPEASSPTLIGPITFTFEILE